MIWSSLGLGGNSAVAVALDIEDNGVTGEERPSPIFIAAERVGPEGAVRLVGLLDSSTARISNLFLTLVTNFAGKSAMVMTRGRGRRGAFSGSVTLKKGFTTGARTSSRDLTGPLLPLVGQSLAR
jgi:hypothetical protein